MDTTATKTTETGHEQHRTLPGALADLTGQTIDLLHKELELAKVELGDKADQLQRGVATLTSGSIVLTAGLVILLASAVLGLTLAFDLPYWLSALIVGGGVTLIGLIMLGKGRHDVRAENLAPERTVAELERDKRLIEEHA